MRQEDGRVGIAGDSSCTYAFFFKVLPSPSLSPPPYYLQLITRILLHICICVATDR